MFLRKHCYTVCNFARVSLSFLFQYENVLHQADSDSMHLEISLLKYNHSRIVTLTNTIAQIQHFAFAQTPCSIHMQCIPTSSLHSYFDSTMPSAIGQCFHLISMCYSICIIASTQTTLNSKHYKTDLQQS